MGSVIQVNRTIIQRTFVEVSVLALKVIANDGKFYSSKENNEQLWSELLEEKMKY